MPRGRVGGMDDDERLGLGAVLAALVGERGVQEQVRLGRDQREREALRQRASATSAGGSERQRVDARSASPSARSASCPSAVPKPPSACGTALAEVDLDPAALAQRVERDAGGRAGEQGGEHLLVGLAEARVVEAHPRGQQPEDLGVGLGCRAARSPARCRSRSDGPRRTPRRGARAASCRAARRRRGARCRSELLQHDGEEVLAAEPLQDAGLVGRDRRRVGVPARPAR